MCLGRKVISQFFGVIDGEPLGVVVEIDVDIPFLEPLLDLGSPAPQFLIGITGVPPDLAVMKPDIGEGGCHEFLSWIIRGKGDAQGEAVGGEDIITIILQPALVSELKDVSCLLILIT